MKTLFPEPKTIAEAQYQMRVINRAMNLEAEGYLLVQRTRKELFGIYKPGNVRPRRGVWNSDYLVDLHKGYELCSCKAFNRDGDCKHRIACALYVEQQEMFNRMAAEYDEAERNSEGPHDGSNGGGRFW